MGNTFKMWISRSRVDFTANSNCLSHYQIDRYVGSTKRLFDTMFRVCKTKTENTLPSSNPLDLTCIQQIGVENKENNF